MPTCVIVNPAAQGEKAARKIDHLESTAPDLRRCATKGPGDARRLAAQAVREGFDVIVAAGGDGTVQEVVSGIADEPGGLERARLGILPLGTINVLARELGIPADIRSAWNVIQQGHTTALDLPFADSRDSDQLQRNYFAQLAGAGTDSRAVALVDWSQKKALGPAAYVIAGLRAIAQPQASIQCTSDQGVHSGQLILIGNGRFYGGSFVLFPKADNQDGLLDVLVYPRIDWESFLEIGYAYLTDAMHTAAGARYFQTPSLTLASTDSVPFQLDGDNVGHLPATFAVRPKALRVLTPGPFHL